MISDRCRMPQKDVCAGMSLKTDFQSTVSAIVYSILQERFPTGDPGRGFPNNLAVRFLLEQHGRMADYLRWPLVVLTLVFDWSSLPRHGRRFHRLSPATRARQIGAWRTSPLGFCRDFIRFYDSLVVFYWYSHAAKVVEREPVEAEARFTRTAV
jgi:hypothetical protein